MTRLLGPVREAVSAAVSAAAALSIARDAWIERRYTRELLADVPDEVEPESGLRMHDLFEWERIFEDADARRADADMARRRWLGIPDGDEG